MAILVPVRKALSRSAMSPAPPPHAIDMFAIALG